MLSIHGMVSSLTLAGLAAGLGFIADEQGLSWAFGTAGVVALLALVGFGAPLAWRARPGTPGAPGNKREGAPTAD